MQGSARDTLEPSAGKEVIHRPFVFNFFVMRGENSRQPASQPSCPHVLVPPCHHVFVSTPGEWCKFRSSSWMLPPQCFDENYKNLFVNQCMVLFVLIEKFVKWALWHLMGVRWACNYIVYVYNSAVKHPGNSIFQLFILARAYSQRPLEGSFPLITRINSQACRAYFRPVKLPKVYLDEMQVLQCLWVRSQAWAIFLRL